MPPMPAVPEGARSLIEGITREIIDPAIGVIFAAGLVLFLWGLAMFIYNADDQSKRTQYKSHMLWGIVGMVIMVSVFALLQIGLRTFGLQGGIPGGIPLQL